VRRGEETQEGQESQDRIRMFVALDLPDRVRDRLEKWQGAALGDPALRAMRPEALHITLCFLGSLPEPAVEQLTGALRAIPARPVSLRFEPEAAPLPKGRPRLYALGARSPDAVAVQDDLARRLADAGLYEPEERSFWPHVTVARVRTERLPPGKGERRGRARPRRVTEPPRALPKALREPFGAVRLALYRSNLKPQGAEYERLDGVDLPSPGNH
jgi:2'-5' RNA ligase